MSIVKIDVDKCVGCNSCIRVCPSKSANICRKLEDGKIVIEIDDDQCIRCGACINACSHNARYYEDDTEAFFEELKHNRNVVMIAAPAIRVTFGGKWKNVIAWLKSMGVSKIMDVSYGADICTWGHLRYLEKHPGEKIISQPCAAIVNYVLKDKPELINNLSKIQSPMGCEAIYIRKYLGYGSCKIAAISPCIAKKDEFKQTGLIDYNVTLKNIKDYIETHHIDLNKFTVDGEVFDEGEGNEGSLYPRPGGLKENIAIYAPQLNVINAEGTDKVYGEFDHYISTDKKYLPDVFDVLNCEFGCNGGPAIGQEFRPFRVNYIMKDIAEQNRMEREAYKFKKAKKKGATLFDIFDKNLDINDFIRTYKRIGNEERDVPESEIQNVYKMLNKTTETEKNFDCHSCGFPTCCEMAQAIAKGKNVPENCRQYTTFVVESKQKEIAEINAQLADITDKLEAMFKDLKHNIHKVKNDAK